MDSLEQDCSNSSALAMELLQACTKPSNYYNDNQTNISITKPCGYFYTISTA